MTVDSNDYRLADFKLLLPLGQKTRTLIINVQERRFLPHLTQELGEVHQVDKAPVPESATHPLYDLVFSDSLDAVRYLRPGGTICHLKPDNQDCPVDTIELIGRWRAFPSWPDFRVLIPEQELGWRAAVRGLRLIPLCSWLGVLTQFRPALAARMLPNQGIALYRRVCKTTPSAKSLLETADSALLTAADRSTESAHFAPMQWMPVSGRLGHGNPILAFRISTAGHLLRLIKLARYPQADHLLLEAQKLQRIEQALGPELTTRIIKPSASASIDGRAVLAYDYVPTYVFFGPRWHLQRRQKFCRAVTDWLAEVALVSRRDDSADIAEQLHRAPLRHLVERNILPPELQAQARQALAWLDQQSTLPTVFEHGDLGIYNARMIKANGSDFQVLDWGSSTFSGIAIGDLAYLLSSARAPVRLGVSCLKQYLRRLELPAVVAAPLWFVYLARRWAELDTVRVPIAGIPESGGGVLLAIHAQVQPYLDRLAAS